MSTISLTSWVNHTWITRLSDISNWIK